MLIIPGHHQYFANIESSSAPYTDVDDEMTRSCWLCHRCHFV